ncbi:MAG: GTP-binding protein [Desulfobacteraceae bacterium]|nr:GTP-binding protein [Desulfobacteraceae bacterium]
MPLRYDGRNRFDQGKISVLLLSGFLGSGKTTLLKRILSWQADLSDTVVLVNEFGDIGIDGDLLKESGSGIVELTSGCICCSLSADLKKSLQDICNRFSPSRIFIESTGVADPSAVHSVLQDPALAGHMTLEKIVTVLDADYWEARENFGPLFYRQLESAHLILLNKIDLIDPEMVPRFLEEIHALLPGCQVVPTLRCGIDPETLWSPTGPRITNKPMQLFQEFIPDKAGHDQDPSSAVNYITFSFTDRRPVNESAFHEFLEALPPEVFRLKGPVRFPERTRLINFVGGKSEWSAWEGEDVTRLAFIGWDVDSHAILTRLARCLISS